MQAILALEDGKVFRGKGYGAKGECYGEVVFNTSITGYQEIFTDPSYAGQIVVLTNPQIGNYGTNLADNEANKPYIEGLVTREFSPISSNWRSQQVADEYLERFQVPVISEIDTRALVRHLRTYGVMRGVISSIETNTDALIEKARSIRKMDGTDLAKVVSTKARYEWESDGPDPLSQPALEVDGEPVREPQPHLQGQGHHGQQEKLGDGELQQAHPLEVFRHVSPEQRVDEKSPEQVIAADYDGAEHGFRHV